MIGPKYKYLLNIMKRYSLKKNFKYLNDLI